LYLKLKTAEVTWADSMRELTQARAMLTRSAPRTHRDPKGEFDLKGHHN